MPSTRDNVSVKITLHAAPSECTHPQKAVVLDDEIEPTLLRSV
jgi:hypothetical protein